MDILCLGLQGPKMYITAQLGLCHVNSSTPYYPQANGQVEAINNVLITMLQCTIGKHKKDWHMMLFSTL